MVTKYSEYQIFNLDAMMMYTVNLENLKDIEKLPNYHFEKVNIFDTDAKKNIFQTMLPQM